jgi:methylamine--corrinoid protein Co-methyltransferase
MIDFLEILDRTKTGEKINEQEYDFRIFKKCNELIDGIGLKFNPDVPINDDYSIADKVFEAAVLLATEVGAYCLDTKRIIKFSENEIIDQLKEIPPEIFIGEGKERKKIIARRPDDKKLPTIIGGGAGPFEERLQVPFYKLIASLPINGIYGCNIYEIEGRRIDTHPLEVWATRRIAGWMRDGIKRAGRPGLHIFSYPLLTRSDVILGVLSPNHIRTTDAVSTTHCSELYKLQYDALIGAHMAHEYGCLVYETTSGMIGGFAGGPEGATIECAAGQILGAMITRFDYGLTYLVNIYDVDAKFNSPEKRWAESLMMQAISRNTNIKMMESVTTAVEPGTEHAFIERVIPALHHVSSGISMSLFTGRPARPKRANLGSPMEIKWSTEVLRSVIKLSKDEANILVKKFYSLIPQENSEIALKGMSFDEGYDMNTFKPKKRYTENYEKARKKVSDLGLTLE